MRGLSLINIGIVVLLLALLALFLLPNRQPEPADAVRPGTDKAGTVESAAADSRHSADPAAAAQVDTGSEAMSDDDPNGTDPRKPVLKAGDPVHVESGQSPAVEQESLQFLSWPKPALALMITGEQLGYFEPCGCTANQLGGMSRRAELFRRISDLGWSVSSVDAGSLSRRSARQGQIKFETMLTAMRELNYVAMGLGPEELRLDPGYLISQHSTEGPNPLRFLSANLTFYGVPDLGTPLPSTIIEKDGLKVGITSVLGESRRREVIPDRTEQEAAGADIQWLDPTTALQTVIQHFDSQNVTFRILLSQAAADESRQFAEKFPSFDVVVTVPSFGDGNRQPEMVGDVRVLQVGTQGKHAGVIGIYPQDEATAVRYELVTLSGTNFGSNSRMAELMSLYQERLKDEQIVLAESPATHPSGATFVGADACGECHTTAYEIWKNTPHAHAFESLDPANRRHGYERLEGVSRLFDPECLSCHVTGWDPQGYIRFRSGFLNTEFAETDEDRLLQAMLAGNQCENCHGPGSRHLELIEAGNTEAARAEVRVTLEQSRKQGCIKCHDGENSPHFDFDSYWEKVKHEGLD